MDICYKCPRDKDEQKLFLEKCSVKASIKSCLKWESVARQGLRCKQAIHQRGLIPLSAPALPPSYSPTIWFATTHSFLYLYLYVLGTWSCAQKLTKSDAVSMLCSFIFNTWSYEDVLGSEFVFCHQVWRETKIEPAVRVWVMEAIISAPYRGYLRGRTFARVPYPTVQRREM